MGLNGRASSPNEPSTLTLLDKTSMDELPQRRRLYHETPSWVAEGALFFVTICTQPRGANQLCKTEIASKLIESAVFYHEENRWWLKLFLLMPDHLHALLAVPKDSSLQLLVRRWKAYQNKQIGIDCARLNRKTRRLITFE